MTTPLLSLPELLQGQAFPYITHNLALRLLESSLFRVLSATSDGPPSSPSDGDSYIVNITTREWAGATPKSIAVYVGGSWYFVSPVQGQPVWVVDSSKFYRYLNLTWVDQTRENVSGDMYKSVYDPNDAGIVLEAQYARSSSWSGISDKPTTFAPNQNLIQYCVSSYPCADAVSPGKVVYAQSGILYLASSSELSSSESVLGVCISSTVIGDSAKIVLAGEYTFENELFTPGPVFLGTSGEIVSVKPTTGYVLQIGFAVSSTKLIVRIGTPVEL